MNILDFIVLGIIVFCCYTGYRKGFLRVVYSLLSWFLVLAFVTWSTPYLTEYLETKTPLQTTIQEKCVTYMETKTQEAVAEQTTEYGQEQQKNLENEGIWLPESIMEEITGSAGGTVSEILQTSGVYDEVANIIAHYIIQGIAFFIALVIAGIFSHWLSKSLNLVSRIPVMRGVNKTLGLGAGAIKGLVIVWLIFCIITLCSTSELGDQFLTYINKSIFLSYLYENNILLQIIMAFL